jgi:hypothetical protein
MLAPDLHDLHPTQRLRGHSPRLPGLAAGPGHRHTHGPLRGSGAARPSCALRAIDSSACPRSWRTCGPRRLQRQSQPTLVATQSGRSAPPSAGHLLEVRPGRVDPETKAQGRALKRTTALSDTLLEETKVWRTANRLTRHAGSPNDSVAVESAGSMTQNRCSPTDGLRRPKACRTLAGPARGGASCRQQGQTDPRSDLASDWRGRHPREWQQRAGQASGPAARLPCQPWRQGRDANP